MLLATVQCCCDIWRYAFLLSRIPDADVRRQITTQRNWTQAKLALAKELAVRRMAEILTQVSCGAWRGGFARLVGELL